MPRASVRTRSTTMEARMAALEAAVSKNQLFLESNQLFLESMQRLLEDKFTSIDKQFESIEARFEGSSEKEGEGSRRRGVTDPREKEKGYPSDNRMPFIKMDFPRFIDGDIPAATAEDVEIAVEAAKKAFSRNKGKDWSSVSGAYRAKYLRAIAAKITERKSELGKLEAIDSGKLCEEGCRLGPVVSGGQYEKIKMVSFHLDREALQWFQWEECVSSCSKWEDFVKIFCRDFGSHGFEDYYEPQSQIS